MIKNLVFDFGNVLIEWNPAKILAAFVKEEDRKRVKAAIFDSGLLAQTDTGQLTLEAAIQAAQTLLDSSYSATVEAIFTHWYETVDVYHQLQEKIFEWAQLGYGIYILSTTSEIFYAVENELHPKSQTRKSNFWGLLLRKKLIRITLKSMNAENQFKISHSIQRNFL